MAIFALDDLYYKDSHAGYKARRDIFSVIQDNYETVSLISFYKYNLNFERNRIKRVLLRIIKSKLNYWRLVGILKKLNTNDTIIVRYPFEGLFDTALNIFESLRTLKAKKDFKVIFIILDLDSVRRHGQLSIDEEVKILDVADKIITHNDSMSNFLANHGANKSKLISLDIFDYLSDNGVSEQNLHINSSNKKVIYAGNLERKKAEFLYNWKPNYRVDLYGINLEPTINEVQFSKKGIFDPDRPKMNIDGIAFGLVWDGNSISTCEGLVGQYLKISNPHKASLYLSQGLPILVWKYSAMATFVEKYNIGYTIENLHEISDILAMIERDHYNKLKKNVEQISLNIQSGFYLKKALSGILPL